MAVFSTPRGTLPKDTSSWLDGLSVIRLEKSDPWEDLETITEAQRPAVDYSEGWADIAQMVDADTDAYATASAGGALARLEFSSVDYSAADTNYIKDLYLRMVLTKTYTAGGTKMADAILAHWYCTATGEEMNVRGILDHDFLDLVSATATKATNDEIGVYEFARLKATRVFFNRVLGTDRFTVAELEAALANIVLTLTVHDSPYGGILTWNVSDIALSIDTYAPAPQTRFEFNLATDDTKVGGAGTAYASIDYSSGECGGSANFHDIPPGTLPEGTYYMQARTENADGWSDFSDDISFSVMAKKVAKLYHEQSATKVYPVEITIPYTVTGAAWEKTGGYSNIYEIPFDRSVPPLWQYLYVADMLVDGEKAGYTRLFKGYQTGGITYYSDADVLTLMDATASSFWEAENLDKLYVHLANSIPPGCYDGRHTTRGHGFAVLVRMNISKGDCPVGPDDPEMVYRNIVRGLPTFKSSINLPPGAPREDSAGEVSIDNSDGAFYGRSYPGEHYARTHNKLIWSNAEIAVKMAGIVTGDNGGTEIVYPFEAPTIFTGRTREPSATDREFSLPLTPLFACKGISVPKLIWDKGQNEDLKRYDIGAPQQEVFGDSLERVPCTFVNWPGAGAGTLEFRAGREVHNVTKLWRNNEEWDFTWDDGTQIITALRVGAGWSSEDHSTMADTWTCDCDGQYLPGTSDVAKTAGDIFTILLTGKYFANLPASAIDASIAELNTVYPGELRFIISDRTALSQILQQIAFNVRTVLQERADGKIHAVLHLGNRYASVAWGDASDLDYRQRYDQYTTIFLESDIDQSSWTQKYMTDMLFSKMTAFYWGYEDPTRPMKQATVGVSINEGLGRKYGVDKATDVRLWKSTYGTVADDNALEWISFVRAARTARCHMQHSFEAFKKVRLVRAGDLILTYRRQDATDVRVGTLGAIAPDAELDAGLMLVLEADPSLDSAGGSITGVFIEELKGWKADWAPRFI